jgi:hypothetical protein
MRRGGGVRVRRSAKALLMSSGRPKTVDKAVIWCSAQHRHRRRVAVVNKLLSHDWTGCSCFIPPARFVPELGKKTLCRALPRFGGGFHQLVHYRGANNSATVIYLQMHHGDTILPKYEVDQGYHSLLSCNRTML